MIKCKNCGAVVPPEFVSAIQKGECPGCGAELFSPADKELLAELTDAMERMPKNPQGVAGWLMSNYEFRKIGEAVPTERFYVSGPQMPMQGMQGHPQAAPGSPEQFLQNSTAYNTIQQTRAKIAERNNLKQAAAMVSQDMYGNGSSEIEVPPEPDPLLDDLGLESLPDDIDPNTRAMLMEEQERQAYEQMRGPRVAKSLASQADFHGDASPEEIQLAVQETLNYGKELEARNEEVKNLQRLQRLKNGLVPSGPGFVNRSGG